MLSRLFAIVVLSGAVATSLAGVDERVTIGSETNGVLSLYRLEEGAVRKLEDGAWTAPGDRVQVAYDAGFHEHGVVYSVDGRARVTLHFPTHADGSTLLDGGRGVLPASFVLDDAPGFERFYFVTSRRPLDVRRVLPQQGRKAVFLLAKHAHAPAAAGVR